MGKDSAGENWKQSDSLSPSQMQIEKLVEVISQSQHNYRDLIDNLDQAVFTLSLEGEVRVANRRMTEILELSFQELIGRRLDEFVESPTLEEANRSLASLSQNGSWSGVVPVRLKKGGELKQFSCWLQAVGENGEISSISGWARDVTAQFNSEVRFKEIFESLHDGIFFTTAEGQVLDVNPSLVRMLGYASKADLQAVNFRQVYANPAQRAEIVHELDLNGSMHNKELIFRRKDGSLLHCLVSGFAVRDAAGRLIRTQGMVADVSERREFEMRLHKEQEFVRRLVASFPDPIIVLDREGKLTFVSQRIQEVLGVSPESVIGTRFGDHDHPDDLSLITNSIESLMKGNAPTVQFEFRARHADGSWKLLRVSGAPLFDESGTISGIVCSVRDTTEARLLEQQLAQKEKFASMGQMMAGAAHELNNPLTAILGISDLLHERAPDTITRRQADLILQQGRRAATIVQNLLAFSRPPSIGWSKIDLEELLREVVAQEKDALALKKIGVKFESSGPFPPVSGDRKLLAQVFQNVLINAEQSLTASVGQGSIELSLGLLNDNLCVTVTDSGPGVAPENARKIFDPFFTTKRPGGGSGLGLTISLAIVKEHGGTIELRPKSGPGATFQICLPAVVRESAISSFHKAPPGKALPAVSEALRGHTILIVDDEESIRDIMREGLTARGMKVVTTGSSEGALDYLAKNSCEVILCDFNLPGLRGDVFFEKVHASLGHAAPQFIFMTGELVDDTLTGEFRNRGALVLQKPFAVSALVSLLTERLQPQLS